MLIVLAVFSILTLMFVAASQQAMVKTRAARAANDQRMLSEQVELYFTYTGQIPNDNQGLYRALNPHRPGEQVPADPFSKNSQLHEPYAYYSQISVNHRWVIISRGPDGQWDLPNVIDQKKSSNGVVGTTRSGSLMTPSEAEDFIVRNSYDPTNGVISSGDIIRVQRGQ